MSVGFVSGVGGMKQRPGLTISDAMVVFLGSIPALVVTFLAAFRGLGEWLSWLSYIR